METAILLIVALPLLGAIFSGFLGTKAFSVIGRASFGWPEEVVSAHAQGDEKPRWYEILPTACLFVSSFLSWIVFFKVAFLGRVLKIDLFPWVQSGDFLVVWSLRVDVLTAVMLVVVTTVSALVHLYSIGYMSHDPHRARFFSYLSLFTFAMLMLVTANNLVQLFFGWEGVGLASYLLIGFWYQKPSANAAAMKAFVVNRVGDFGFALGIFLIWTLYGSLSFDVLFANAPDQVGKTVVFFGYHWDSLTVVCLLLLLGAMGKSAQFLLHTWLPDAMEGPTPVSALIHAATMVTAGVFMIARLSPFYELAPVAQNAVLLVGGASAFFAATVGLVQNDIKRVIAYSTCSQLGYMFAALGVGAEGVAIFHLFTHAFFKALLFLGSGSVIHALSGEQDMRFMGGLKSHLPKTFLMMLIGTLALTGFPLTAGFFSKDAIFSAVFVTQQHFWGGFSVFVLLLIGAFCTSFYSWRVMFLTFYGQSRAEKSVMAHVHESPQIMLIPLYVLAFGALSAGLFFKGWFIGHQEKVFWSISLYRSLENRVVSEMHHVPIWVEWSPFVVMVLGFLLAFLFYIRSPHLPKQLALSQEPLYRFLLNKWYFDALYHFIFVRPVVFLGRIFWKKGDGLLIDGLGPNGISARIVDSARLAVRLQTGYVYHYAFAMLIGILLAVVSLAVF